MPTRTARTAWTGTLMEGGGQVALVSSGAATFDVTFPRRTADEAAGVTSPEELIAAAHSSCFAMHAGFFYLGQTAGPLLWTLAIANLGAQGAIVLMAFGVAATGLIASAAFRRLPKVVSGAL